MGNHAHSRPKVDRSVIKSKPRIYTRTRTGVTLPAIPLPYAVLGWRLVRCWESDCRRWFLGRRRYNRHYVCDHVYKGLLG